MKFRIGCLVGCDGWMLVVLRLYWLMWRKNWLGVVSNEKLCTNWIDEGEVKLENRVFWKGGG